MFRTLPYSALLPCSVSYRFETIIPLYTLTQKGTFVTVSMQQDYSNFFTKAQSSVSPSKTLSTYRRGNGKNWVVG